MGQFQRWGPSHGSPTFKCDPRGQKQLFRKKNVCMSRVWIQMIPLTRQVDRFRYFSQDCHARLSGRSPSILIEKIIINKQNCVNFSFNEVHKNARIIMPLPAYTTSTASSLYNTVVTTIVYSFPGCVTSTFYFLHFFHLPSCGGGWSQPSRLSSNP